MYPSTLYGDDFIRLTSKPILVEIKKYGRPGDEVAHTGYVENISCFRG